MLTISAESLPRTTKVELTFSTIELPIMKLCLADTASLRKEERGTSKPCPNDSLHFFCAAGFNVFYTICEP